MFSELLSFNCQISGNFFKFFQIFWKFWFRFNFNQCLRNLCCRNWYVLHSILQDVPWNFEKNMIDRLKKLRKNSLYEYSPYLIVKFLHDRLDGLLLNFPGLRGGGQVTAGHDDGLQLHPMLGVLPVKLIPLQDALDRVFVGEKQGEIRGEDAVFNVSQHLPVLLRSQRAENVMAFLLKNGDRLVEMMVLCRGKFIQHQIYPENS